ncbi:lipoprotein [Helicobacter fennelliae]|uniref:Lipoprotein n=1 Tax=Helicobacter fennelliae TaxID=215 RepID=A0A2X3DGC8_9HELI|nr:hypothetical protein [Helicobacter fennelliae]SQB98459.1 lipoprotein [Helicobacter fennelliae]
MNKIYIFCVAFVVFFVVGCGSKKYYEPTAVSGQIIFDHSFKSPIDQNNRYAATLKDSSLLTQNGIIPYTKEIPKDSRFLNESGGYYIFAKGCELLILLKSSILDSRVFDSDVCQIKETNTICTQDEIQVKNDFCAVSASIKGDLLAVVGTDNSSTLYKIPEGEVKFSQKGSSVIAVNQLVAAPLFLDTLVVFPTLDGKLLVVSIQNFEIQRNIILGGDKFFNNIIYLGGDDSRIFAATSKKLISIISGQEFSYTAELMDVFFDNRYLYALTLEGRVIQLDHTLREVNALKFPFASLEGIVIVNNHLYTYEKQGGYIIDIMLDDFSYKVYRVQDMFGKPLNNKLNFYTKNIFYYDRYYFDFSRLQ